jgi:hypothetical protein
MVCKWTRFAYRFFPLPAWRAFLLDRHINDCPSCQGVALGIDSIRSLGITPDGLEGEPNLSPFAADFNILPRCGPFRFRWSYVFACFLAAAALGTVVVMSRMVTHEPKATGHVYVNEAGAETCVFAIIEAEVGGKPARPVVFKPGKPGMTIVWFEKKIN